MAAKRDRAEPALEDADRAPDRVGEAASEAAGQAAGSAEHPVPATAPADDAAEHAVPATAPTDDAAKHAVPAAAPADDTAARERELQLLSELGVDPHDRELDAAIRGLQAGATEELPFGRPGKPLSERSPLRIGFHAALGVLLAAALTYTLVLVAEILVLLVVALFLATGLDPAVESLRRRGLPRSWAVTMVAVTFLLGVTGFFVTAVPPLVRQGNALREQAPSYARELRETSDTFRQIDDRLDVVGRLDALNSGDAIIDQGAYRGMLGFARGLLSAVFATLTVLVLTLYFLVSYPGVKRAAYQLVPRSRRARPATSVIAASSTTSVRGVIPRAGRDPPSGSAPVSAGTPRRGARPARPPPRRRGRRRCRARSPRGRGRGGGRDSRAAPPGSPRRPRRSRPPRSRARSGPHGDRSG